MSIRIRLALLLSLVVVITLGVAFWATRRAFTPFAKGVLDAHLDQVIYVADELDKGADARRLGDRLGLDIRVTRNQPRMLDRPNCQPMERRERHLVVCRGPRAPIGVERENGWVVVRRDLEATPERRIAEALFLVALIVVALSAWIATLVTRPLGTTVKAMEQMAAGDLSFRLPKKGGRDLREVSVAFNALADRVEQLLRAERELMAGISHELRTPLARLRLQIELLRDQGVPEKRLDAMENDLAEVDRLIGELLELSRLSLGERKLVLEPLDLLKLVEENLAQAQIQTHTVVVKGQSEPVLGDRTRLSRLLGNLLQNACKYAPSGTEITISVNGGAVEVSDRGPGVPVEDLPKLFEPFFRGQKNRQAGLGLGLMIARQVVTLHGGQITAQNRPDGGLTIRFVLPTQKVKG